VTDVPQPGPEEEPSEGPEEGGTGGSSHGGPPPSPFGNAGPFGIPGFDPSSVDIAQLMRLLQSEGPVNWEIAKQVAEVVAVGEEPEAAVDATAAAELDGLARAAETHVAAETGIESALGLPVRTVGRREWAELHLEALRPVLLALASTLQRALDSLGPEDLQMPEDAPPAFGFLGGVAGMGGGDLGNVLGMLAPLLLGVQSGSMVGYLAQHALGRYDLPLPTSDAPTLTFVVPNLVAFEEAWSLEPRELRFYVALHEAVRASLRTAPGVQDRLVQLATDFVSGYEIDPAAFEDRFGTIDPNDPEAFSAIAEHPEQLLGAIQSERQQDALARMQSFTTVLEGYADVVLERVGGRLLGEFSRVHEAMQRHHVERGEAERFIEGLLGLRLEREHYERGAAFCHGVIERAGMEGLNRLWEAESRLPTPSELEAPGLWLARIDLPEN
jgi:putative hydrolase